MGKSNNATFLEKPMVQKMHFMQVAYSSSLLEIALLRSFQSELPSGIKAINESSPLKNNDRVEHEKQTPEDAKEAMHQLKFSKRMCGEKISKYFFSASLMPLSPQ